MNWQNLCKKWSAIVVAVWGIFLAMPISTVNADAATAIGAVIGEAINYARLSKVTSEYVSHYDKTEEGRQEFFQIMKKKYGVNNDYRLNSRLDDVMANLTTAIGKVDSSIYEKPYLYFLNNDTSFNAFCSLGHTMTVNTGVFSVVANDDELAVIIGHEMGHGQERHAVEGAWQKVNTSAFLRMIGSIAANGSPIGAAIGNQISDFACKVHMTRAQEREADKLAFQYIIHSGYNPGACAAIWQRVMEWNPGGGSSFLSDHPDHKDRRDTYANSLTEYSGGKVVIEADSALIKVNGKDFVTPAAVDNMSSQERAYFVMGNLATAYHNGCNAGTAWTDGNVLMLGDQPIMKAAYGDPSVSELAARLNAIK